MERARGYSRSYRDRNGKREDLRRYARRYMRSRRQAAELFRQVFPEGEQAAIEELARRMEATAGISFRKATLQKLIRDGTGSDGYGPLTDVGCERYELKMEYFRDSRTD